MDVLELSFFQVEGSKLPLGLTSSFKNMLFSPTCARAVVFNHGVVAHWFTMNGQWACRRSLEGSLISRTMGCLCPCQQLGVPCQLLGLEDGLFGACVRLKCPFLHILERLCTCAEADLFGAPVGHRDLGTTTLSILQGPPAVLALRGTWARATTVHVSLCKNSSS